MRHPFPWLLPAVILLTLAPISALRSEARAIQRHPAPQALIGPIKTLAFSPDARMVATGSDNGTIAFWSARTGAPEVTFQSHQQAVKSVAFSPGGRWLASAGDDGTIRLWNVAAHRLRAVLRSHKGIVYAVAFSPNGRVLVSGGDDQAVRFWSLPSLRLRNTNRTLHEETSLYISQLAFSPDGQTLAVGTTTIEGAREESYYGSVELWKAPTWRKAASLNGFLGALSPITFSSGGRLLATAEYQERGRSGLEMQENTPSGAEHGVIRLWNARTGKLRAAVEKNLPSWPCAALSPRSPLLAVGLGDGRIQLWNTNGPKLQTIMGRKGSPIQAIAFSPGGHILAAGLGDGTLWVRHMMTQ